MDGLVVLVLIGALVAFGWTRLRRTLKMPVAGKHWLVPILIVIAVGIVLWSVHTGQ